MLIIAVLLGHPHIKAKCELLIYSRKKAKVELYEKEPEEAVYKFIANPRGV